MKLLLEMLAYKRPEGSDTQKEFCDKYLNPVFGMPDCDGNYLLSVGDNPNIIFTAHHDTVHRQGGMQSLLVEGDTVTTVDGDCLGADCTTGIFIMLEMIAAQVPGLYVIHAGEELGCIGSRSFVEHSDLSTYDACISFDRMGTGSIITHQCGLRTASDAFARSLEGILGLGLTPDDSGVYTDSNEYRAAVSECTNVSVGYYRQHSKHESQDLLYLRRLVRALIAADWTQLVFERDQTKSDEWEWAYEKGVETDQSLVAIVQEYPEQVAALLEQFGYSASGLLDEIEVDPASCWRFA